MSCAGVVSEGSRREREEYRVSAGKRIDVQEGECFVRLEELVAGDFALDYFAEDADCCHFWAGEELGQIGYYILVCLKADVV
jgi:hypothetical protein